MIHSPVSLEVADQLNPVLKKINNGDKDLSHSAAMAYQAFLGYYLGKIKRTSIRNKAEAVSIANDFSSLMGLSEVPGLEKRTAGKMGLNGVEGVKIKGAGDSRNGRFSDNRQGRGQRGGGGRGKGGRGNR